MLRRFVNLDTLAPQQVAILGRNKLCNFNTYPQAPLEKLWFPEALTNSQWQLRSLKISLL